MRSFVAGQNSNAAVVEELAPPASPMSASEMIGIIGCQKGWAIHLSDTQQAYAQIELKDTEKCVSPQ